jgi:hypothetical protein
MNLIDGIGLSAGAFVILAFYARRPATLRIFAICSNLLFVAYAAPTGLWPVLVLHVLLLPLNVVRLSQSWKCADGAPAG